MWKPNPDWQGFCGTPVNAPARDLAGLKVLPDIYLCGPPALIDATEAAVRSQGVPIGQVFSERFLPA